MKKRFSYFTRTTKRGVASLYVVIFATVLFGVITISFSRIMLSGEDQSSKSDLSQSAYDSALAGIESAKVKIAAYYQQLSAGGNPTSIFVDFNTASCPTSETLLQSASNNTSDQAVTCVLMSDLVPDYRSRLTPESSTRIVPIAINDAGTTNGTSLGSVKKIKISWYSAANYDNGAFIMYSGSYFHAKVNGLVPPLQVTLIRTGRQIYLDDYKAASSATSGLHRPLNSTMVFLPSSSGTDNPTISATKVQNADKVTVRNDPFLVKCDRTKEFTCSATLDVDGLFQNGDNAFLVLTLPYRNVTTDFMVQLYDSSSSLVNFKGVQIRVDSTGRTNQLFRRVEARLERTDPYFPYPSYAVELSGGGSGLYKNKWYSANCWNTYSLTCPNNGGA